MKSEQGRDRDLLWTLILIDPQKRQVPTKLQIVGREGKFQGRTDITFRINHKPGKLVRIVSPWIHHNQFLYDI